MKTLRRIGRVILTTIIVVLTLLLTLMISVQIPFVQTKIATYAVSEVNKAFDTQISVERVDIDFFGDFNLYGITAEDDYQTQFINIKRLEARISLTAIIRNPDRLTIRKLKLHEPKVKVITYKGDDESNFIELINKFSSKEKKEKSDFVLRGILDVTNGELLIQNQNLEGYNQNWIDARRLNLKVENFKLENNEIWGDLIYLSFEGRRNDEEYVLKNFSGDVHYGMQEIRVDQLNFETEDSYLDGNLVLSYDSISEMKDFANKVNWDVEFKDKSKINFKDIRYFVQDFNKNSTVDIIGKVSGTLNDLQLSDFQLSSDGTLIAANQFSLIEMTSGEKLSLNTSNVKIKTSYTDLVELLPTFISQTIPDFMNRFGTIDYLGDFELEPEQINIKGNVITALGAADLTVKLDNYRNNLAYSGTLLASKINLKQVTEIDQLGFVNGKMNFDGKGTDLKTLRLTAKGNLDYIDLIGNRYNNIIVNGLLQNEKFTGHLAINDRNINLVYDGTFDFSKTPFQMEFTSQVKNVSLDFLGITKDLNAHLTANLNGDLSFSNLDDFLGTLSIDELYFTSKADTIEIPHAHLVSNIIEDTHNLELDVPDYLKGEIHGQYKLSQLPDIIMNSVSKNTILTYEPKSISPNQKFSFFFEVEQNLFSLIDPKIQIAPGTILDGQVDGNDNTLIAELSSIAIGYNGFDAYGPLINIDTSKDVEPIYIRTDSANIKGTMVYNLDVHTTPIQDSLLLKTKFKVGKEADIDFDLNLYHTLDENKNLVFGFSPSEIEINDSYWQLNPNNKANTNRAIINFDKNFYQLQNISLISEDQKLKLDGYFKNEEDYKLNANLEDLIISRLIPKGLLGELEIDGIINGSVDIVRNETELKPLMELRVNTLSLNKYDLGNLYLNGVYNVNQNVFDVEMYLNQKQVQVLYLNGYIDNKTEKPELNLFASLDDFDFNFIESFLSAAMSKVRGKLSGEMRFTGPFDSPEFNGMLDLNNLGFTVDFLNVDYSFDGVNTVPVYKASGSQGFISLDQVNFRDTKYNTRGEVTGQLLFRDFASWFLNLSFNTRNLLVMDTNIKQNDLFYGTVFGQGAFELFGPPERLDISASATINDGSEFTINTGATKIEAENTLVRFVPETQKKIKDGPPQGMNIDLEITATPSTTVNLVIDPQTNDMVIANGFTEKLKFNLSRSGAMNINGTYTLDTGEYQLRQIPLLNRNFDIKKGSYVRWNNSSPFEADLDIVANYERTVTNVGEFVGSGQTQAYDVVLGINITETLSAPSMNLTLDIPKAGSDVKSLIDYKFNLDPGEKMIQFGSILLFGRFNTETESIISAGASSTGTDMVLKQLSGVLNSLISGGGVNFDVDYIQGSNTDFVKTNLRVDLSPRWTFKGVFGVAVGSNSTYQNSTTTGEAEIEWDASKQMDQSIVFNFFTRPTNFGIQSSDQDGGFQSVGAGIVYRTSFDKLPKLFNKKDKSRSIKSNGKNALGEIETKKDSIADDSTKAAQDSINISENISETKPNKNTSLIRFK